MRILASLFSGIGFSIFIGLLLTIIQIINPRTELKSYPQGIKDIVSPETEEEKRKYTVGRLVVLLVIIILILVDFFLRINYQDYFFVFLHFLIVFCTWAIFDLIVMDWLIFCTLTPSYLVFPGTEKSKEYKDYLFHLRGLFFGVPFSIVFSIVLTCFIWVLRKLG